MPEYILAIIAAVALLFGFLLGWYITFLKNKSNRSALEEQIRQSQLKSEEITKSHQEQLAFINQQHQTTLTGLEKQLETASLERETIRKEKDFLSTELTRNQTEFQNLQDKHREQKDEVEKLQEKFTKEFENLANKILDEKSTKFTEQNKINIHNILNPLQEKINRFEEKVDKTHKESIDYHAALRQQILGLKDLNEQMSKETTNLTRALKGDNKMQGNWGELVLERVLEKSGLEKDREYFVQQSFTTLEGKRVLPDVVINLPDGKKMVIDSKVSLIAYERFVNEEDMEEKRRLLKEHILSVKRHVDQLSEKNYQDLYDMESPDFVLLFVPIEPAFAVVINEDRRLSNQAF